MNSSLYTCECFVVSAIATEIEIVISKSPRCHLRTHIGIESSFKDCYFRLGAFSFRGSQRTN